MQVLCPPSIHSEASGNSLPSVGLQLLFVQVTLEGAPDCDKLGHSLQTEVMAAMYRVLPVPGDLRKGTGTRATSTPDTTLGRGRAVARPGLRMRKLTIATKLKSPSISQGPHVGFKGPSRKTYEDWAALK